MTSATATRTITRIVAPSDEDFGGRPYLESSAMADLADYLIENAPELERLQSVRLTYRWKAKAGKSKGLPRVGSTELIASQSFAFIEDIDEAPEVMIWLGADTVRDEGWTTRQIEAALFGQLSAIWFDDKDALKIGGPDVVGYSAAIRRYGAWNDMLTAAADAFRQASLFSDD